MVTYKNYLIIIYLFIFLNFLSSHFPFLVQTIKAMFW